MNSSEDGRQLLKEISELNLLVERRISDNIKYTDSKTLELERILGDSIEKKFSSARNTSLAAFGALALAATLLGYLGMKQIAAKAIEDDIALSKIKLATASAEESLAEIDQVLDYIENQKKIIEYHIDSSKIATESVVSDAERKVNEMLLIETEKISASADNSLEYVRDTANRVKEDAQLSGQIISDLRASLDNARGAAAEVKNESLRELRGISSSLERLEDEVAWLSGLNGGSTCDTGARWVPCKGEACGALGQDAIWQKVPLISRKGTPTVSIELVAPDSWKESDIRVVSADSSGFIVALKRRDVKNTDSIVASRHGVCFNWSPAVK